MTYLLALDQGTSSSRAILFSTGGEVVEVAQKPLELFYPQNGWVEQDPKMLVDDIVDCVRGILDKSASLDEIAGVGITNQRETVIVWDRNTGEPVYNAIVWQDRRTADYCVEMRLKGHEELIGQKTGLLLDPYFSATKIKWILENIDGARARAEAGELIFGTVDCYLLWHLTKGKVHATDITNASRTMLYNIVSQEWDRELFDLFDIPMSMIPAVMDNVCEFGRIDSSFFGDELVIGGMAGDQQSALIGQGCFTPGMVKSTYGTGCFALLQLGERFVRSENRLLTTVAYSVDGSVNYALEGSIFNAGTVIQFLRDNFGFFEDAKETEEMALSIEDNGGVFFVPAFTGLGAPYWDPDARGVICGLGRDTSKAHVVRAALEAQGYQTRDLLTAMQKDAGQEIKTIRADGGLVVNDFICRFLANICACVVEIPKVAESTAWGSACLAGVQAGVFDSLEDSATRWQKTREYYPEMSQEKMDKNYQDWLSAVDKAR